MKWTAKERLFSTSPFALQALFPSALGQLISAAKKAFWNSLSSTPAAASAASGHRHRTHTVV